jgi:beta-1,4-mannooligosaccharide/beta-1,4-mannosyl-N-acetylglucosamine phosphorylase
LPRDELNAASRPTHTTLSGQPAELFHRYAGNPLLTAADWPYPIHTVFNPGTVRLASGETLLLVRAEDRRSISHLTSARSRDGITQWRIDPAPTFAPSPERYPEELWGVEDARKCTLTASTATP